MTLSIGRSTNRGESPSMEPASEGMRAPRPLPRPPSRAMTDLLCNAAVRGGTASRRIERDDGLAEWRGLGETHRPRDDRPKDLVTKVFANLFDDLIGQLRAGVV